MPDTFISLENVESMLKILSTDSAESEKPIGSQVKQCLHNLIKIIRNVIWNNEFLINDAVQWGINLGRIQELFKISTPLWANFEKLFLMKQWQAVEDKVQTYLTILRMERPTIEFIRK